MSDYEVIRVAHDSGPGGLSRIFFICRWIYRVIVYVMIYLLAGLALRRGRKGAEMGPPRHIRTSKRSPIRPSHRLTAPETWRHPDQDDPRLRLCRISIAMRRRRIEKIRITRLQEVSRADYRKLTLALQDKTHFFAGTPGIAATRRARLDVENVSAEAIRIKGMVGTTSRRADSGLMISKTARRRK